MKKFLLFFVSLGLIFLQAVPAQAYREEGSGQEDASGYRGQLTNPAVSGDLGNNPSMAIEGSLIMNFAVEIWRLTIQIGALIVVVFYVIAAFEWLTSGSDSKGIEKAKNRFINATIGLILLVSSFAIIAFISQLLFGEHFNLLEVTIPDIVIEISPSADPT